jgi:hypothetical protein
VVLVCIAIYYVTPNLDEAVIIKQSLAASGLCLSEQKDLLWSCFEEQLA